VNVQVPQPSLDRKRPKLIVNHWSGRRIGQLEPPCNLERFLTHSCEFGFQFFPTERSIRRVNTRTVHLKRNCAEAAAQPILPPRLNLNDMAQQFRICFARLEPRLQLHPAQLQCRAQLRERFVFGRILEEQSCDQLSDAVFKSHASSLTGSRKIRPCRRTQFLQRRFNRRRQSHANPNVKIGFDTPKHPNRCFSKDGTPRQCLGLRTRASVYGPARARGRIQSKSSVWNRLDSLFQYAPEYERHLKQTITSV
jgi:hypothetical protein